MTTVAFDGIHMAADRLAADGAGLKSTATKIFEFEDCVVGVAGEYGQICKWIAEINEIADDGPALKHILKMGYPRYNRENDNNNFMVVERSTKKMWVSATSWFIPREDHVYAIGSGRDFAIAAMHCGRNARGAVEVAALFDLYTNDDIQQVEV